MSGGWNAARGPADQRDTNDDSTRWDLKAACALDDLYMYDSSRLNDQERAETRRTCRTCPVRLECLTDAIEQEKAGVKVWGIRGGKTQAERAHVKEARRQADVSRGRWTPEDDALVRANALEPIVQQSTLGRSSAAAFAASLGRTIDAVRIRRNVLRRRDEKEAQS